MYTYDRLNRIKAQNVFKGTAANDHTNLSDNGGYTTTYIVKTLSRVRGSR